MTSVRSQESLARLAPLLNFLRGFDVLNEVRETQFHLKGKDFIHFHDDETEGLVADVRLAKGRIRMPVATRVEQAELMDKISAKLDSLEGHQSRTRDRHW